MQKEEESEILIASDIISEKRLRCKINKRAVYVYAHTTKHINLSLKRQEEDIAPTQTASNAN